MIQMPPQKPKAKRASDEGTGPGSSSSPAVGSTSTSRCATSVRSRTHCRWSAGSLATAASSTPSPSTRILVSRIMEDQGLGDPMEGLLHDGIESVLADIARPAKNLLKDYKALDAALDSAMRKQFVLPETDVRGLHQGGLRSPC